MKVVRRDRFELSLSGYKPPVLTTELSEHIALITFFNLFYSILSSVRMSSVFPLCQSYFLYCTNGAGDKT